MSASTSAHAAVSGASRAPSGASGAAGSRCAPPTPTSRAPLTPAPSSGRTIPCQPPPCRASGMRRCAVRSGASVRPSAPNAARTTSGAPPTLTSRCIPGSWHRSQRCCAVPPGCCLPTMSDWARRWKPRSSWPNCRRGSGCAVRSCWHRWHSRRRGSRCCARASSSTRCLSPRTICSAGSTGRPPPAIPGSRHRSSSPPSTSPSRRRRWPRSRRSASMCSWLTKRTMRCPRRRGARWWRSWPCARRGWCCAPRRRTPAVARSSMRSAAWVAPACLQTRRCRSSADIGATSTPSLRADR